MTEFTLVHDDGIHAVDATRVGDSIRVAPVDLLRATGWELKPQGLCRGDVCVPVRDRENIVIDGLVDVRAVATALRAPLVLDDEIDIAVLGASAGDRQAEREAMRVPSELALSDLDGNVHTWGELGAKKKVLAAWASW